MKPGDIIKHKRWKDLALEVLYISPATDGVMVHGEYINMGFTSSWHLGIGQHSHIILHNKQGEWERMLEGAHSSIRYNKWKSL
jgi:hypothetical protein